MEPSKGSKTFLGPEGIQAEIEPLVPLNSGFQPYLHSKITKKL